MRYFLYLSISIILFSCKEEENLCDNHIQDPDEEGVDCGGGCGSTCYTFVSGKIDSIGSIKFIYSGEDIVSIDVSPGPLNNPHGGWTRTVTNGKLTEYKTKDNQYWAKYYYSIQGLDSIVVLNNGGAEYRIEVEYFGDTVYYNTIFNGSLIHTRKGYFQSIDEFVIKTPTTWTIYRMNEHFTPNFEKLIRDPVLFLLDRDIVAEEVYDSSGFVSDISYTYEYRYSTNGYILAKTRNTNGYDGENTHIYHE